MNLVLASMLRIRPPSGVRDYSEYAKESWTEPKVVKVLRWQYGQMEVIDKLLLKSLVFEGHLVEYQPRSGR